MCMCVCMCVCVLHVCLVPVEAGRGHHMPWNWNYRQKASMWMLGLKLGSLGGAASAHNYCAVSPAPAGFILNKGCLICWLLFSLFFLITEWILAWWRDSLVLPTRFEMSQNVRLPLYDIFSQTVFTARTIIKSKHQWALGKILWTLCPAVSRIQPRFNSLCKNKQARPFNLCAHLSLPVVNNYHITQVDKGAVFK